MSNRGGLGIDLRAVLGVFFALLGVVLAVFGALSAPAIYRRSLGINVNLIWGIVLAVFGAAMLWLGTRTRAERR